MEQKGTKMGWTFGGLGALLWMLLLAGVLLAKGNTVAAVASFCFFIVGILYIILFALPGSTLMFRFGGSMGACL